MKRWPVPCKKTGCAETTRHQSGYCQRCKQERPARPLVRRRDPAAQKKAKAFYSTKEWRQARAAKLKIAPRCEIRFPGCTERAECVDHIRAIAKGGDPLDQSNLQSSCWRCHSIKTARVDGGWGHGPRT